jgi:deoxycytidylate deaminase
MPDSLLKIFCRDHKLPYGITFDSNNEYFMSVAILTSKCNDGYNNHLGVVITKDDQFLAASCDYRVNNIYMNSSTVAIANCAKRGISLLNAKIYMVYLPSTRDKLLISLSGINEIFYMYNNNDNNYDNDNDDNEPNHSIICTQLN